MTRRAKIIGTLGPSSNTVEIISDLIQAGLNVARINMSHGTHETHQKTIKNIRLASKGLNKEIGILVDLQGPKIRVDKLDENLTLKDGDTWFVGSSDVGKSCFAGRKDFIPTVYKSLVADCSVGERVLFDDGLIRAEVIGKDESALKIKVFVGGELKSNKGINLPDTLVSAPSFTGKDREDLLFGIDHDVDFIALSFVRKREDIQEVRKVLKERGASELPIIAKVENPEAIDNLDEIIDEADIIMVARGDMGVELGNHLVPRIQKRIIQKCNNVGKIVITATQMLESMIVNSTPTRAEASDIANSIWDGTDVVMLSGETAAGKYPIEAVKVMDEIVCDAELRPKSRPHLREISLNEVQETMMVAASIVAEKIEAEKIILLTFSGASCLKISKFRPVTPVMGITPSAKVQRMMSILWGVTPVVVTIEDSSDVIIAERQLFAYLKENYDLKNGDRVVITRGQGALFGHGISDSLRVEII